MKTDPRSYAWALTPELADMASKQGLPFHDIYLMVCNTLKAKGDYADGDDETQSDFVEFVDPAYITTWIKNNVRYKLMPTKNVCAYSHLRYHGKEVTAGELSKLTGLRKNTIYIYWAKSNKDPTAFDLKIDRRIQRYRDSGTIPEEDYSGWEVSI